MMRRANGPGPRSRAFVAWTLRHGRLLWTVAILLAIPATWRTAQLYLHLRSEMEELLPRQAESVLAIQELKARTPGLQFLGVIVDTGSADKLPAGEKLLDDLAARVRAYPKPMVGAVRLGNSVERTFLEDHAPLYVDLADLRDIRARIEARRDWEVSKETGESLDDDSPPPPLDFSDLKPKYEARLQGGNKLPTDRYSSPDLHLTMMLIEVGQFSTAGDTGSGKELFERVKADVAALGGTDRYAPRMKLGYTGDVAINVEELSALVSDLSVSSVLVLLGVGAVIVAFYRWWRSLFVLVVPLLLATVYAFALASLPPLGITELNTNTAFLGSIIVGNGINFGIILLARYLEERRRGVAQNEALVTGVWSARVGTLSAALAAGVSYASLVMTQFRGFRQFGFIGGIGMVMSWLVAFVLMPPLAAWLDREGGKPLPPKPAGIMERAAPLVVRSAVPISIAVAVLTLAAAWAVSGWSSAQIDYDLSKLRRADTWTKGEGYWGQRMDELLGRYITPTVILADTPEQANAIAAAVRDAASKPPLNEMISMVRSADDVLPPDEPAKIEEADAIREDLTPKIRSLLSADDKTEVDRLLGKPDLHPLTVAELPSTFTTAMRERDGTLGRTVLVYPRPSKALWEGPPLVAFVQQLRALAATGSGEGVRPGRVAGSLPLSADILGSVIRDGPRASLAAFLGVVAVVILLFRWNRVSVFVVGSLVVGVLFLFAATVLLHIKINFANFIAFPITFGIGVDYSVNVMSRYVQDGARDPAAAMRGAGGAVVLCSLTTILGYSSLLLAENRALYLFGLVAVLGEIACLTTAVIALPAVLVALKRGRGEPFSRPSALGHGGGAGSPWPTR